MQLQVHFRPCLQREWLRPMTSPWLFGGQGDTSWQLPSMLQNQCTLTTSVQAEQAGLCFSPSGPPCLELKTWAQALLSRGRVAKGCLKIAVQINMAWTQPYLQKQLKKRTGETCGFPFNLICHGQEHCAAGCCGHSRVVEMLSQRAWSCVDGALGCRSYSLVRPWKKAGYHLGCTCWV